MGGGCGVKRDIDGCEDRERERERENGKELVFIKVFFFFFNVLLGGEGSEFWLLED